MQSKHISDIKTSILYVNNKPDLITLDYTMDVPGMKHSDHGYVFTVSLIQ